MQQQQGKACCRLLRLAQRELKLAGKKALLDALFAAARLGHHKCVSLLIERGWEGVGGAAVSAVVEGHTALMIAALNGHPEVVGLLIERGAVLDAANKGGFTALIVAAGNGHPEVVKLLIQTEGDRCARCEQWGRHCLGCCCSAWAVGVRADPGW